MYTVIIGSTLARVFTGESYITLYIQVFCIQIVLCIVFGLLWLLLGILWPLLLGVPEITIESTENSQY